jgi:hypothetical protein
MNDEASELVPQDAASEGSAMPRTDATHPDGGIVFWVGAAAGWVIIVIGIRMGLNDPEVKPALLLKWVAGGLVLHDAVWLMLVAMVGAAVAFALRREVPVVLAWALATTAVLTLIAWPFVRGYGRLTDVPSALQRNYARGLIVYLMVIWLIAVAVFAVGRIRRRRTAQKAPS